MVDIPPEIISRYLDPPCIIHFKDVRHGADSGPHFYSVLPAKTDARIIICIITSQIGKREKFYKGMGEAGAINCFVRVNRDVIKFLNKDDSIVNCNEAEIIPRSQLYRIVDKKHGFKKFNNAIPPNLANRIKNAIINSPLVRDHIKIALS